MIKKGLITGMMALAIALSGMAQGIELGAYGGYMPSSKTMYNYYGYRLRFNDGANFSASLGVSTPVGVTAEFNFTSFSSSITQEGGIPDIVKPQPVNIQYYQIGVLRPLDVNNENLIPFGLVAIGASHFNPTELPEDYWRFAFSLGVGLKYFFTPVVGIRLQARMLMPMYFNGFGFGCSIGSGGSGCGGGAGFGSEIIQGEFSGGVVLRFNQ